MSTKVMRPPDYNILNHHLGTNPDAMNFPAARTANSLGLSVPSAGMYQICGCPALVVSKAKYFPSGDQAGLRSWVETLERLTSVLSSNPKIYICGNPSRKDVKAIRFPSGDHAGSKSPPGVVARGIRPLPSPFIKNNPEPS